MWPGQHGRQFSDEILKCIWHQTIIWFNVDPDTLYYMPSIGQWGTAIHNTKKNGIQQLGIQCLCRKPFDTFAGRTTPSYWLQIFWYQLEKSYEEGLWKNKRKPSTKRVLCRLSILWCQAIFDFEIQCTVFDFLTRSAVNIAVNKTDI